MKILISGSNGFIGQFLVSSLKSKGNDVFTLKRERDADLSKGKIHWDPSQNSIDFDAIEAISPDVIINLSGENPFGIWTENKKEAMRNSRIRSTRILVETIKKLSSPPHLFLSVSGISYYGSHGSNDLTEDFVQKDSNNDFFTQLAVDWEKEAMNAAPKTKVIILRTGVVLHSAGGALQTMTKQFQWFMGGVTGDGEQYMSWITIKDWVRAVSFLIKNSSKFSGPVNLVSPNPTKNADFVDTLSEVLRVPAFMWAPKSVLQFVDNWVVGGLISSMLLASQRVIPKKLLDAGFVFEDDKLKQALWDIYEDNGGM